MGGEFKRLILISGAILFAGAGLLILPLMKMNVPQRPGNVPGSALYAKGRDAAYWIDCPNFNSVSRYYCTVYAKDGANELVRGVFQQSGISALRRIAYDRGLIHWKNNLVLTAVHLDCISGGRPPDVPDCRQAPASPALRY